MKIIDLNINIEKIRTAKSNISINDFLLSSAKDKSNYIFPDTCAILEGNKLIGSLSYGDIKRKINKLDRKIKIQKLMNKNPVSVSYDLSKKINFIENLKHTIDRSSTDFVYIVDKKNNLLGIIKSKIVNDFQNIQFCDTIVFGLGLVGLTLSIHLTKFKIRVQGIEINTNITRKLNKNITNVNENGLLQSLKLARKNKLINFTDNYNSKKNNKKIFIVCVGTPVTNGKIEIKNIQVALKKIAKNLPDKSLIILRSTIPVGSSRHTFIPLIEKISNKKCGKDWHFVFAPERTVEGNALNELNTLPQLLSGFTSNCLKMAKNYFDHFSSEIIELDNLEMAEYSKLICNTYRDLTFAFANDIALLCEKYNINANKLIQLSNKSYPRGGIPLPSPGVGGSCLTKDPFIYSMSNTNSLHHKSKIGFLSREINHKAAKVPFRILNKYKSRFILKKNLSILILGLSFKGDFFNNDLRNSTAKDLADYCIKNQYNTYIYDSFFTKKQINKLGYKYFNIFDSVSTQIDFIFVMNNNIDFKNILLDKWLESSKIKVFFDPWYLFPEVNFKKNNFFYTTMGKLY